MDELQPPDTHYISAATGWLELGLADEARKELAQLSPAAQSHPDTLALEWELCARSKQWTEALAVAGRLIETDGTRPAGWINRSYALHELRRTAEARASLLPALPLFPSIGIIPYNLACYACQLGNLDEARTWLRKAMEMEGREVILDRARGDADLRPLRGEFPHL